MRKKRLLFIALGSAALLAAASGGLLYTGVLRFNYPSHTQYPIRGVDVSSYQGDIDWPVLAGQGIRFAFIKATEGSGGVDPRFQENLEAARKTDLRVGAYHFFSYDSGARSQAANFIANVPRDDGLLPPVVDVEFYGDKEKNPPSKETVQAELTPLLAELERHFGKKPILYATEKSYALYIAGSYPDADIWIRNVLTCPSLSDSRDWTFWQYANRVRLKGYSGREPYIDMNAFCGTAEAFERYGS